MKTTPFEMVFIIRNKMQLKYHMITIEDLGPKDHLLRKVEAVLDLSFVYEETDKSAETETEAPP